MTFKEQLNAFSAVKFPLMLAIFCIHVQNTPKLMTFDWYYVKFWAEVVGRIGVPLFFFISGVMFFCNIESNKSVPYFIKYSWKGKMKRRLRSLLVPYIIWNLIAFLFFYIKKDVDFTFTNLMHSLWDYKKDGFWFFPINGVFWFIRDLFIVSICSPLIYLLISQIGKTRLGGGVICTLIILFIIINTQYSGGSLIETFILFSVGGIIGLYRLNVIDSMIKWRSIALLTFIALSIFHIITLDSMYSYILEHLLVFIGAITFVGIFYKTPIKAGRINLLSLSMFIFASHAILRFIAFFILNKINIDIMWMDYSLRLIFTVGFCIITYGLGSKICPKLLHLSIGGR